MNPNESEDKDLRNLSNAIAKAITEYVVAHPEEGESVMDFMSESFSAESPFRKMVIGTAELLKTIQGAENFRSEATSPDGTGKE